MSKRLPREMGHNERLAEFSAAVEAQNDLDVALVELVRCAIDLLTRITGSEFVHRQTLLGVEDLEDTNWGEALKLDENIPYRTWPVWWLLHDLSAYAHYGIDLGAREHEAEDQVAARLQDLIERAEKFLALCPLQEWLGADRSPQLERTVRLARNRWELDHDRPVEPEALAWFGNVKMSRMQNMLSGKDAVFHREHGFVPAQEAKTWLETRTSFFPSIWRRAHFVESSAKQAPVFVPQSWDGSIFHPSLERHSGFTIGKEGGELQVPTFWEALRKLQEMPIPTWRRPGPDDRWDIVQGVSWTRVNRTELMSGAGSEAEPGPPTEASENDGA